MLQNSERLSGVRLPVGRKWLTLRQSGERFPESRCCVEDKRPLCQLSSKRLEDNWHSGLLSSTWRDDVRVRYIITIGGNCVSAAPARASSILPSVASAIFSFSAISCPSVSIYMSIVYIFLCIYRPHRRAPRQFCPP